MLQDELPGLYAGNHAYLCTSEFEGWGMPMLEAMAVGVPVVTTLDADFVQHGRNCLCTGGPHVDELVQSLQQILRDEELARTLAEGGRQTAAAYSLDRMGHAMDIALHACVRARDACIIARAAAAQDVLTACGQAAKVCQLSHE